MNNLVHQSPTTSCVMYSYNELSSCSNYSDVLSNTLSYPASNVASTLSEEITKTEGSSKGSFHAISNVEVEEPEVEYNLDSLDSDSESYSLSSESDY